MKYISRFLITLLFFSISLPVLSQDCTEFGNNHFMKWIDFDASCIGIEDLVSKIEREGKWDLMNKEEQNGGTLIYRSNEDTTIGIEVSYLNLENKGASYLIITFTLPCRYVFESLENRGYPKFPNSYYEQIKTDMMFWPINIENLNFAIGSSEEQGVCSDLILSQLNF